MSGESWAPSFHKYIYLWTSPSESTEVNSQGAPSISIVGARILRRKKKKLKAGKDLSSCTNPR